MSTTRGVVQAWMAAVIALASLTGGRAALASGASAADDEAARHGVAAALATYRDLAAAGKWSDVASLYADDVRFRWWSNGVLEAHSAAELRKGLLSLPAGTRAENTYHDPEIQLLAPGVALVSCAYETRVSTAEGAGYGFGGWITMTFIEKDGAWRILNGHASAPLPRRSS